MVRTKNLNSRMETVSGKKKTDGINDERKSRDRASAAAAH